MKYGMIRSTFLFIFVALLMIIAGAFIGSITGQAVKGGVGEFSDVEIIIVLVAFVVAFELVIISIVRRKNKKVNIKELLQNNRRI